MIQKDEQLTEKTQTSERSDKQYGNGRNEVEEIERKGEMYTVKENNRGENMGQISEEQ